MRELHLQRSPTLSLRSTIEFAGRYGNARNYSGKISFVPDDTRAGRSSTFGEMIPRMVQYPDTQ